MRACQAGPEDLCGAIGLPRDGTPRETRWRLSRSTGRRRRPPQERMGSGTRRPPHSPASDAVRRPVDGPSRAARTDNRARAGLHGPVPARAARSQPEPRPRSRGRVSHAVRLPGRAGRRPGAVGTGDRPPWQSAALVARDLALGAGLGGLRAGHRRNHADRAARHAGACRRLRNDSRPDGACPTADRSPTGRWPGPYSPGHQRLRCQRSARGRRAARRVRLAGPVLGAGRLRHRGRAACSSRLPRVRRAPARPDGQSAAPGPAGPAALGQLHARCGRRGGVFRAGHPIREHRSGHASGALRTRRGGLRRGVRGYRGGAHRRHPAGPAVAAAVPVAAGPAGGNLPDGRRGRAAAGRRGRCRRLAAAGRDGGPVRVRQRGVWPPHLARRDRGALRGHGRGRSGGRAAGRAAVRRRRGAGYPRYRHWGTHARGLRPGGRPGVPAVGLAARAGRTPDAPRTTRFPARDSPA